jgi:hypothetical protein
MPFFVFAVNIQAWVDCLLIVGACWSVDCRWVLLLFIDCCLLPVLATCLLLSILREYYAISQYKCGPKLMSEKKERRAILVVKEVKGD